MTTSTLRYNGPRQSARTELVHLLQEFPQVFFRELDRTEYEVTAEAPVLNELAKRPGWSLGQSH